MEQKYERILHRLDDTYIIYNRICCFISDYYTCAKLSLSLSLSLFHS